MVYNLNDLPLTLRVEEVAEILRIGRGSAYELIRCGKLHAIRMGRRILVPRSSLESFWQTPLKRQLPQAMPAGVTFRGRLRYEKKCKWKRLCAENFRCTGR